MYSGGKIHVAACGSSWDVSVFIHVSILILQAFTVIYSIVAVFNSLI